MPVDAELLFTAILVLVDDWYQQYGVHLLQGKRGRKPEFSDSEVITIEIMGAFLGIETDKGIYTYFKQNYGDWFPALRRIHRTTFTRQMANLWWYKKSIWKHV